MSTVAPNPSPSSGAQPATSGILTGAGAVLETLVAHGIEHVFGIPGGHSFAVYAALQSETRLRHILGRHEQGLGYMAEGYYRASGKIAAVSTTSGPAVANIASPLGQATTDTSAFLVIASAPNSRLIGRNRGGLHDLNDQIDMMRPVCRYVEHCATVDEISPRIASVIERLRYDRPGGAFVQIPTDVLGAEGRPAIARPRVRPRAAPDPSLIDAAARLLANAKRPLIVAGSGALVSDAGSLVATLAERLGAVVSTTMLARGIVPSSADYSIFPDGPASSEINPLFAEADVVLAVGTMFKQEDTCGWQLKMGGALIHVDIDAREFGRSYPPTLAIEADARAALEALVGALPATHSPKADWRARAQRLQQERLDARAVRHPAEMRFIRDFRNAMPQDTMFFADRCNIGYWISRVMPCDEPRTFHYPMGYGGLGGSLPQAIGAKIASPDRRMVAILGDGGMQFTLPELAVAVQEKVGIPIVVTNNHSYGAIKAGMMKNFQGKSFGTDLSGPDWGGIAAAYGIPFQRHTDSGAFLRELARETDRGRLSLFEFVNDLADPQ